MDGVINSMAEIGAASKRIGRRSFDMGGNRLVAEAELHRGEMRSVVRL